MIGPGNEIADADRERVIETLKVAFVQERLTMGGAGRPDRGRARRAVRRGAGRAHRRPPGRTGRAPAAAREAWLSKKVRDGLRVIGRCT